MQRALSRSPHEMVGTEARINVHRAPPGSYSHGRPNQLRLFLHSSLQDGAYTEDQGRDQSRRGKTKEVVSQGE